MYIPYKVYSSTRFDRALCLHKNKYIYQKDNSYRCILTRTMNLRNFGGKESNRIKNPVLYYVLPKAHKI